MVRVEGLKKRFGKHQVLKGIDISIEEGKVHAILGHNGSGKTTLIKNILGLVVPTEGKIEVNGMNVANHWEYRKHIGYMSQIATFPQNLTVKELLDMVTDLRGPAPDRQQLLEQFGLLPELNKKLGTLSGGTRQKVNAVLAFMHRSPLLICDEPTVGLDPVSLLRLKAMMREAREEGQTVVIITHIMSLVEELADEVIYLQEGEVHFQGSVSALKDMQSQTSLEKAIASMMIDKQTTHETVA